MRPPAVMLAHITLDANTGRGLIMPLLEPGTTDASSRPQTLARKFLLQILPEVPPHGPKPLQELESADWLGSTADHALISN